jgi:hypothetical protein
MAKWTPEEIDVMRQYVENTPPNKRSFDELAQILGRPAGPVALKASRIGITFHRWTEDEIERIRSYYENTQPNMLNLYALASEMGRERTAICGVARSLGLTDLRRPKRTVQWGPSNPAWKSNTEGMRVTIGHDRARRRYPQIGTCEVCKVVPATERHHIDTNTFNNLRSNIVFCCHRCHMVIDGRLEAATVRLKSLPKRVRANNPCKACGERIAIDRGRCHRCSVYFQRNGTERPPVNGRYNRPVPVKFCTNCGLSYKVSMGLCHNCYVYKNRTGRTRPIL